MGYFWLKTFHIVFLVSWYAGLFYLPRLFVHHAMSEDAATRERLEIMERKLFWFITPWAVLTVVLGLLLSMYTGWGGGWLHLKTSLVVLLLLFHFWCWRLMREFRGPGNPHSHVWFRWFNEFPLLILVAAVYLVVFKPF
ncbi:MAG: CopD family protein [Gammaproteobacteria bacterium SHHR-1]|uniref:CopD family protein n=1 Tax=Magnetovirga frankeli TaxID=947516 RepID=UPI001293C2B7|nr:CopD family protein [gamma proteobacterium SS-5]